MTTRYPEHELSGVFASMHEGGHALYEHNVDPALERTPLCRGTSLALHESQSRMFENLVGRSIAVLALGLPARAASSSPSSSATSSSRASTGRSTRWSRR